MNLSTFTLAAIVALGATTETIATARIGRDLSYDATKCFSQQNAIRVATISGELKTNIFTADECSDLGGYRWRYGYKNCNDSTNNSANYVCWGKSCRPRDFKIDGLFGCKFYIESGAFAYGVGASITAVVGATLVLLS